MSDPPKIAVEFFGVPRLRAGVAECEIVGRTLGEVIARLGDRFPKLASDCFAGSRLRTGYVTNVNGERFTDDPDTPLAAGDHVLLLSADVGG